MSKLNINKTEWLELVFEGKNKAYGAYQLRQEEGKTTTKAFVSAMALLGGIAALPFILSSFTDKPEIITCPIGPDISIHVTEVKLLPKKVLPPTSKVMPPAKAPKTIDLVNPTVVDAEEAPDTNITTNVNLGQNTPTDTNTGGTGNGSSNTGAVTTPVQPEPVDNGNEVLTSAAVEKNPSFPGGIDEFLRIVGNRFKTPEVDEEGTTKRVIVFFVVEKDGSLSNITVPRNPGLGLDKEAIRVLKSIKTKWEPGIYKGRPVRTQYSLPIVVQMQ
ncbi:energy transducer TonB [Flavobacterium amniphilum]|uniref:energy transducer TonB n=1 Tax=Flavobacterium amniphilum TaxID=1834035 RepID=UPI002029DBE0|nr:energy transducer TonB [Flavobacterium amniphilum]MCL9805057.1 energy transducer TonB [Flavobacterium amniphilum]